METFISLRSYGQTAMMLRGTIMRPRPERSMFQTTTLHHSSSGFQRVQYSCRWRSVVPIVRAKVDDKEERGWMEKAKRGSVASSVVFACVVGMMSMGMGNREAMSAVQRAVAGVPGAGRVTVMSGRTGGLDATHAIQSLMEVSKFLSTAEEDSFLGSRRWAAYKHRMPEIDAQKGPSKEDVDEIKKEAMYKMKAGKFADGEKVMKDEYEKWKGKGGEVEFNLEMAIVEILISQGRFEEANEYNCIKLEQNPGRPDDPRIPLYKAIIKTALLDSKSNEEEVKKAKTFWDEFKEKVGVETGRLPT